MGRKKGKPRGPDELIAAGQEHAERGALAEAEACYREALAKAHDLEVIYRREYESPRFPEMRARKPVFGALIDLAARAMNLLLLGSTDVRNRDHHVILRKR